MSNDARVAGILLAGGQAQRLGGIDKGLVQLAGRTLAERAIARLAPQVEGLIISANRNLERYAEFGCPVVADQPNGHATEFQGPLAGILAAGKVCATNWLLTAPCDCPFLPVDLVKKMLTEALPETTLLRAANSDQIHFVIMLFRRELLDDMETFLKEGGRKVQAWQARQSVQTVVFPEVGAAFFNINNRDDLAYAGEIEASGF